MYARGGLVVTLDFGRVLQQVRLGHTKQGRRTEK